MNRWIVVLIAILATTLIAVGCSGGNGTLNPVTPGQEITSPVSGQSQSHSALLGYYEITLDPISQTMEIVANRTADYTINIIPFLNQMPGGGISFGSLDVDDSDPDILKVAVDFEWHHPFPTIEQYKVYDFMGVIISNGDSTLHYKNLKVGEQGTNTYMTNADGYTRWFNPSEFTTTLIFGWAPGGIQNLAGNAKINPYKYYAEGLSSTGDLWAFMTGGSNNDGVWESAAGRLMQLEFPNPPAGDGLTFAYAAVCCWEEQGAGPYTPYHRDEAIACQATITPSLYFVDATHQGGNFIADIDVWSWDEQPSVVKVESTVLADTHDCDPGVVGGDNYSTYHIDIPKDVNLTGTTGHEFWVVAESSGYNYINIDGVSAPPSSVPLAAFWRFPLFVASEPYNQPPVCDLVLVTTMPVSGWGPIAVEFDASATTDPDPGDVLTYEWDFDGDSVYSEDPDDSYTGTETNPIHVYTDAYTGVVNLKVTDPMAEESICTSENLEVDVKTSCGTLSPVTGSSQTFIGSARLYAYPPEGSRAASPERVFGSPNGAAYSICAIDPNSTSQYFVTNNNPTYSWYNLAVTSSDRIYFNDSGSSNTIYYMDYSNSTGFTNVRTASSFGVIPSGTIHKLVVDENDYPVVLTQQFNIYHWDGSSWGTAIAVPAAVQTASGGIGNLNDFDYDPTTGFFLLVERNGNPGVYAVKNDGTLAWYDDNIWAGACSGWDAGVEVMQNKAECRIILGSGIGGYGSPSVPFYFARINPLGGEKVTSSITNAVPYGYTFAMFDGNGGLMKVGTAYRWYSATYGGNVWGYATMPADF